MTARHTTQRTTSGTRRERGFSIIEMLATVALIGVLASVVLPRIERSTRAYETVQQARQIHTRIAKLRARAVAEQKAYRVEIKNGNQLAIQRAGAGNSWSDVDSAYTLDTNTTMNDSKNGTITFLPSGRVDVPTTISIADGHRTHEIQILASGMARWYTGGTAPKTAGTPTGKPGKPGKGKVPPGQAKKP